MDGVGFRESVPLHRIQSDPGGIQELHCGETEELTYCNCTAYTYICVYIYVYVYKYSVSEHSAPAGGGVLWWQRAGKGLLYDQ